MSASNQNAADAHIDIRYGWWKTLEFDYTFVEDEEEKLLVYYWKSIIA